MSDIFNPAACCDSGHPAVDRWNSIINDVAPQYRVPPNLVKAHMEYESDGDPNIVGSSGRGLGLMQIDYGTQKNPFGLWFYSGPNGKTYRIFDPRTNILIACRDFIAPAMKAFPDNLDAVVASYNAGITPVADALALARDLALVTFRPWYIPSVVNAYSYFNSLSDRKAA